MPALMALLQLQSLDLRNNNYLEADDLEALDGRHLDFDYPVDLGLILYQMPQLRLLPAGGNVLLTYSYLNSLRLTN